MRRPLLTWGVVALLAGACQGEQEGLPLVETTPALTAPATTAAPVATEAPVTIPPEAGAPWAGPALAVDAVPGVLVEEWGAAENRETCAALFPESPSSLAPDATIRRANFAGGWAVAWDRPEGPGRQPDGSYCEDCGRGAYGIAGTGVGVGDGDVFSFPGVVEWEDGSAAGYGVEGGADAASGAPWLAFLEVAGEACMYNVWSFLGESHLLTMLNSLRFVEDLGVGFTDETEPPAEASDLGPAPWDGNEPLAADAVPAVLIADYEGELGSPAGCPLLAPAALPGDTGGAQVRDATNRGEVLIAWDLPAGPGRYGTGDYCADCGRGAIVLGTLSNGLGNLAGEPVTHRFDDGTTVRVVNEAEALLGVPAEGLTDPQTGAAAVAPFNAYLEIPGFSCAYQVWSFLGADHVVELVQQLRRVAGYEG